MSSTAVAYVIDDDQGSRKSVELVLKSASIAAQSFDSAEAFLAADLSLNYHCCIVLDLRMPKMGGMELLQRLREANHQIPVVIVTGHADVPTAVRGMKFGAIDLLEKPFEPSALVAAVVKALAVSAELHKKKNEVSEARQRIQMLTARELDLLRLVVAGRSNKQIAADLNISVKTVANHRANLMSKTGAHNAADLTRMSIVAGIRPEKS